MKRENMEREHEERTWRENMERTWREHEEREHGEREHEEREHGEREHEEREHGEREHEENMKRTWRGSQEGLRVLRQRGSWTHLQVTCLRADVLPEWAQPL